MSTVKKIQPVTMVEVRLQFVEESARKLLSMLEKLGDKYRPEWKEERDLRLALVQLDMARETENAARTA